MIYTREQVDHEVREAEKKCFPAMVMASTLTLFLGVILAVLIMDNYVQGKLTKAYEIETKAERKVEAMDEFVRGRGI